MQYSLGVFNPGIVVALLAKGQNPNIRLDRIFMTSDTITDRDLEGNVMSKISQTPLHCVSENADLANLRLLLQYSARVNDLDDNGRTPLEWAAWALYKAIWFSDTNSIRLHLECVTLLLDHGARRSRKSGQHEQYETEAEPPDLQNGENALRKPEIGWQLFTTNEDRNDVEN